MRRSEIFPILITDTQRPRKHELSSVLYLKKEADMAKKFKDAKKTGLLVGFVMNLIALLIIAILMGGLL